MFLFGPKTVFFENTLSRKTELFDKLCLWSEKQRFSINPVFEKEIFFDKLGQKNSVFRSIKKRNRKKKRKHRKDRQTFFVKPNFQFVLN